MKTWAAHAALLGLLLPGPAHGYQLRARWQAALGGIWHLAPSQLYFLLGKLEREGLIQGKLEPQGPRPPRRTFSLTPAGEKTFWEWATSPVPRARDLRVELLAKLYFLHQHAPHHIPGLLAAQSQRLLRLKDRLARHPPQVSSDPTLSQLVTRFRLRQLEALLRWLEEAQASLAPPSPDPPPSGGGSKSRKSSPGRSGENPERRPS